MIRRATAEACANIALVKYWGKRDATLNLPATGSLSLTLSGLVTRTTVTWAVGPGDDTILLDGKPAEGAERPRIVTFLDLVRELTHANGSGQRPDLLRATVESTNGFPRAAGLASSASGFAALALAATRAAGLELADQQLSVLARRVSGSACRSIFGGFAEWLPGSATDGQDSHGVPLLAPEAWDVRMLVAVLAESPKPRGSRDAMNHTVATSPYFEAWRTSVPGDLDVARQAISSRDLMKLGELAESNALRMHATMLAARPPVLYWLPETVAAMRRVWELRDAGLACWFTIDAGPNVKVLCDAASEAAVAAGLSELPGIRRVIASRPGPGVRLLPAPVPS